jgi:hypothetical protein
MVLIGVAFALPVARRTTDAPAPEPLVVGVVAFVLSSLRNVIAISGGRPAVHVRMGGFCGSKVYRPDRCS